MKRTCKTSSRRWRPRGCPLGLTLIELIAALAILSVLLTGLLLSKARLQRQWAMAERRLAGIAAADQLLGTWHRGPGVPLDAAGRVAGDPPLAWRTTVLSDPDAQALHALVVRLEVFDLEPAHAGALLASVEVLAPIPDEASSEPETANEKQKPEREPG